VTDETERLYCFGSNLQGELAGVTAAPFSARPLPMPAEGVWRAAVGVGKVCALFFDGGVGCWGSGAAPSLSSSSLTEPATTLALADDFVCVLGASGRLTCACAQAGPCPPRVPPAVLAAGFQQVVARGQNLCVLGQADGGAFQPGRVRCYGPTFDGGSLSTSATSVTVGVQHACWLEPRGLLVSTPICQGSSLARGPFDGGSTTFAAFISPAGDDFTCMVGFVGGLSCWGRNDLWQLGADGGGVLSPSLPNSTAFDIQTSALGWNHGCQTRLPVTAVSPAPPVSLTCWGDDSNGKLGLQPGAGPRLPTLIQP
jgi:hypothetical protein